MKPYFFPFHLINNRWHVDPLFSSGRTEEDLQRMLGMLLERHAPKRVLILRPMSVREQRWLLNELPGLDADLAARMIHNDAAKVGGRTKPKLSSKTAKQR